MIAIKRLLSSLFTLLLLLSLVPTPALAYDCVEIRGEEYTGRECQDCGGYMWVDVITCEGYFEHSVMSECVQCGLGGGTREIHSDATGDKRCDVCNHYMESNCSKGCIYPVTGNYWCTTHSEFHSTHYVCMGDEMHYFLSKCSALGYNQLVTRQHSYSTQGVCACGHYKDVFSVTVPTSLAIANDESGNTYTSTASITNSSTGAVQITAITVQSLNGWTIVPYSTNMANQKVNSRLIGLEVNNVPTKLTSSSESLQLSAPWQITEGDVLSLTYDAVISATSVAFTDEAVLQIVFVVEWIN